MGSFFDSVQVRTKGETDREAVIEAVREVFGGDGRYQEIDLADAAHRTVIVGPAGPWTAVYAQDVSVGTEEHARLATALSKAVSDVAVGVLVHDSDVLLMHLYDHGAQVDIYDSWPSYFEEPSDGDEAEFSGDPQKWAGLLAGGATLEALCDAFGADDLFAESVLARIGELFGWPAEQVLTGFRYLESTAGHTALYFRRAGAEAISAPPMGPPTFERQGYTPHRDLSVGDEADLFCTFANTGHAGRGLVLAAWGSAVDAGLVEATRITVRRSAGETFVEEVARLEAFDSDQGQVLQGRLDAFEIPEGAGPLPAAVPDPTSLRRMMAARRASQLWIGLPIRVSAAGEGDLHIGVVPAEHPDGQSSSTTHLVVTPTLRAPRHYTGDANASQYLRAMDEAANLCALVVLDAEREEVSGAIATAFEAWHGLLGVDEYVRTVIEDLGRRPKTGKVPGAAIPDGKAWKRVRERLGSAMQVTLMEAQEWEEGDPPMPSDAGGFGLVEPRIWSEGCTERPLLHVGFAAGIRDRPEEDVDRLEAALAGLIDTLMGFGGVQAFVARWAWTPLTSVESIPYEGACGIHGQCTGGRDWATRYLRAVTDRMWLGPELRERVDPERLAEVARVEAVGDSVRLVLRDHAGLDDLEEAVAGVLASADDWRRGVDRLYGRGESG